MVSISAQSVPRVDSVLKLGDGSVGGLKGCGVSIGQQLSSIGPNAGERFWHVLISHAGRRDHRQVLHDPNLKSPTLPAFSYPISLLNESTWRDNPSPLIVMTSSNDQPA